MRLRAALLAAIAGLGLAACATTATVLAPDIADQRTLRTVSGGEIIGFTDTKTGAEVWRGIPFAAPPIGDLRWRAPRPATSWDSPRLSVAEAPWCLQLRSGLDDGSSADAIPLGQLMGQEDCLYLNVYAPPGMGDAKRPVMMWIHGGSNTWGRAEQYNPAALAAKHDVVVAVVQYRLGPMGWFAHPALRESALEPNDKAANFGLLDQIAALKWLETNAAVFGGDPDNVTIFGESAGGHNVVSLLASPLAKGLFDKAIIQSGSFRSTPIKQAEDEGEQSGRVIAAKLLGTVSSADGARLRAVPAADLFAAYPGGDGENGRFDPPRIIQDGVVLASTPLRQAFASPATYNAVPIITGTNKDELKLWQIQNPDLVKWRFGAIPIAKDPVFYNKAAEYPSRAWRAASVDSPAAMMVAGGNADIWTYRFDWDEGRKYLGADFGQLFGAAHSLEIPFVMGQWRFLGDADKYIFTKQNADGREALSGAMMDYWANFARYGDPSARGNEQPVWTRWTAAVGAQNLMVLDTPGPRMIADRETPQRIVDDLAADTAVTPVQECRIFEAVKGWQEDAFAPLKPATC